MVSEFKKKREKLQEVAINLKKKFVGLDDIIDKIISNITAWYLMPDIMLRPVIINLWGLTGVGKTDLVRTLVAELEFGDKFAEVQLKTTTNNYLSLEGKLETSDINTEDQSILLLDEIQRFRTKDEEGRDLHNEGYYDIWQLLSDGKFSLQDDVYETLFEMMYYLEQDALEAKEKEEEENEEVGRPQKKKRWKKAKAKTVSKDKEANKPVEETTHTLASNHSVYYAQRLKRVLGLKERVPDILKMTPEHFIEKIKERILELNHFQIKPFSKMLIFISGNLDEAYRMANKVEVASTDADIFYEHSKTINVVEIKRALLDRFTPEQISRFGNTHIIYPSLSKKSYEDIIKKNVEQVLEIIKEKHNISIVVDQSILDAIYRNGVYPTQGVRPVFSTIKSLLEATVPNFLLEAIEKNITSFTLFINENDILYTKNLEYTQKVELSLDDIKDKININQLYQTVVHECGHILMLGLLFNIAPIQINFKSTDLSGSGFIGAPAAINTPESIMKKIKISYGGRLAEELVFGNEVTDGAMSDTYEATKLATDYIKIFEFANRNGILYNAQVAARHPDSNAKITYNMEQAEKFAEELLKNCKFKAKTLLENNQILFKNLIYKAVENYTMSPEDVKEIFAQQGYNLSLPAGLIYSDYKEATEIYLKKDNIKEKN